MISIHTREVAFRLHSIGVVFRILSLPDRYYMLQQLYRFLDLPILFVG